MKSKRLYIPIWYNSSQRMHGERLSAIVLYIPIWYNSSEIVQQSVLLTQSTLHSNLVQFKPYQHLKSKPNLKPLHSNLVQFKPEDEKIFTVCHYNFTFQSGTIQAQWEAYPVRAFLYLYIPIWYNSSSPCASPAAKFLQLYIPIWYNSSKNCPAPYINSSKLYIPIWYNSS